jgi:hypothetical protein
MDTEDFNKEIFTVFPAENKDKTTSFPGRTETWLNSSPLFT